MLLGRSASTDLYQRALDQFLIEAQFYLGEVRDYVLDLSGPQRALYLCAFILFLIYVIVARARRKYNPGSLGRQFIGAVVLVGIVLIGGNALWGTGGGTFRGLFQI